MLFRTVVLLALAFSATTVHAAAILDQKHDNSSSGVANSTNGNVSEVGQTFTVGIAGTLDHIDVLMFRLGGIFDPTGDPVLRVYNTTGGLPTGAALATATVSEAAVPLSFASFVSFDVSSAAIAVDVGDVLAFGISTTSSVGPYFLLADGDTGQPSDYADGSAVSRLLNPPGGPPGPWAALTPSQDHGFRTYVIPEPSSLALLAAGVVTVGAARLARRRR